MANEKQLEKKLRMEVRAMGGFALKWVSPGVSGVPDRILVLPGGRVGFAEIKSPGRELGALQKVWRGRLERLGFHFFVVDSLESLRAVLHWAWEGG